MGTNIDVPRQKEIYPHMKILTDPDNNKVIYYPSILICCDEGVIFQVSAHCEDFKIFILILSVFYCFNIRYPANYGMLELLDRSCNSTFPRSSNSIHFANFFYKFNQFFTKC